jgi:hypothetical protein
MSISRFLDIFKLNKKENCPPSIYFHEWTGKRGDGEMRGSALRVERGVVLYQGRS